MSDSSRSNRVTFVLQKYRLDELTFIDAQEDEAGKKLGHGKLMSDWCFQKFMENDPSGNYKYLDWMLFIAGGGQDMMDNSLKLWDGEGPADPNSLRNQCRADFVQEQLNGFSDERGVYHAPVSRDEADELWKRVEERCKFEFVMGDQDVAAEDGYGFYRNWPGRDGLYQKIANAIKLWHSAQPKLLAQNQRYERYQHLQSIPSPSWTADDHVFMSKAKLEPPSEPVVLDIYAGWRPREFSQKGAVYNSLNALLRTLADVRKMQILRDVRYDTIYEDERVVAVCPLTIGASLKFGINKWCVSNKSEFDRAFDVRGGGGGGGGGNWERYCKMGPLVFMCWKVPMPAWHHRIALHLIKGQPNDSWTNVSWIDCKNTPAATSYNSVLACLEAEIHGGVPERRVEDPGDAQWNRDMTPSDERYFKWAGRKPGPAWDQPSQGRAVITSFERALAAVKKWAPTFDESRIVVDYVTDIGTAVCNSDE